MKIVILCGAILLGLLSGCSTIPLPVMPQPSAQTTPDNPMQGMDLTPEQDRIWREKLHAGIQLEIRKEILPSGLTLLLIKNPQLPLFSYYTFYRVGSRYETKGLSGATHYLEHLMFKGSKNFGSGTFDTLVEGSGGSSNAFTTQDNTVYHMNMPVAALETTISLEADRMLNLLFEPKGFESEKSVVLEERKMRYENSPEGKLFLSIFQTLYERTPYAEAVIGSETDIRHYTPMAIENYYKQHYRQENAIVVIAGDIEFDATLALVKKYYASKALAAPVAPTPNAAAVKPQIQNGKIITLKAPTSSEKFFIVFAGHPIYHSDNIVLDLVAAILGGGQSSYFTQEYVMGQQGWLSSISAYNYNMEQTGLFYIAGEMLGALNFASFQKKFQKALPHICQQAITARSLEKAKNQYFASFFQGIQSNSELAEFLGFEEYYYGDFTHYKKTLQSYQNVSLAQALQSCQQLLQGPKTIFRAIPQ